MSMVLIVGLTWTVLAIPVALFLGRALRDAGRPETPAVWIDEVEQFLREQPDARTTG